MHITEVTQVLSKALFEIESGKVPQARATLTRAFLAAAAQESAYELWLEETHATHAA